MYSKIIRYLLSHIVLILVVVALVLVFYYRDFLFTDRVNASIDNTVSGLAFWRAEKSPSRPQDESAARAASPDAATGSASRDAQTSSQQLAQPSSSATYGSRSMHGNDETQSAESEDANHMMAMRDGASADTSDQPVVADNDDEPQAGRAQGSNAAEAQQPKGAPEADGKSKQARDTDATQNQAAATHSDLSDNPEADSPDTDSASTNGVEHAEAAQVAKANEERTASTGPAESTGADTQAAQDAGESASEGEASNETTGQRTNRLIRMARNAFQQGDMAAAEEYYRQFIENDPRDPNAYGELGNVYYEQGKWEQAGKAYYEAAVRLLEVGETSQVEYLLRIIQGLHPQSAEKLQQKMAGQ